MQMSTEKNTLLSANNLFQRLRGHWGRWRMGSGSPVLGVQCPGCLVENNVQRGSPLVLGRWVGPTFEEHMPRVRGRSLEIDQFLLDEDFLPRFSLLNVNTVILRSHINELNYPFS